MPDLYLEYAHVIDGAAYVQCGVTADGMNGVRQCSSLDVLAAASLLADACRAELTGKVLGLAVIKRPVPEEVPVVPVPEEVPARVPA